MNALSRSNAREISHFFKIVMSKLDFHPGRLSPEQGTRLISIPFQRAGERLELCHQD
jgi:hypothetical protein